MIRADLQRFFARTKKAFKPNTNFSVFVSTVVHRNFDPESNIALLKLLACPEPRMIWHPRYGTSSIDIARSLEATTFLEKKLHAEVLLFLDDDVVYEPQDIRKMCVMCRNGYDIIGAPYVLKQVGNCKISDKLYDGQKIVFSKDSEPVEVRWLSGGCMCIRRKALQTLSEKLPKCSIGADKVYPFFCHRPKEVDGSWVFLPEGWSFSELARENGLKVWLDASIRVAHVGRYAYTIEDAGKEPKKAVENVIYSETQKTDFP